VFSDIAAHQLEFGDVGILPPPNFFYGLEPGEEIAVDIEEVKTLIIRLLTVGNPHVDGTGTVFFELNGLAGHGMRGRLFLAWRHC